MRYLFLPGPMEGVMTPEAIKALTVLDVCDEWITPFLRISQSVPRDKILAAFLAPFQHGRQKITVQLMGHDSVMLAKTAERLLSLGAYGIDLNFGCPSGQVLRHGAGGALLRAPNVIAQIVRDLKSAIGGERLSVKLRGGFVNFDKEIGEIFSALLASQGKLRRIVLHYRSVREGYREISGAEERYRKALALAEGTPLVANGEIFTVTQAHILLDAVPALTGIMIARGFFHDPWLLRRLEGREPLPGPEEGREIFYRKVFEYAPDFPPGKAIELGNLIWRGKDKNPYFAKESVRFNKLY